MFPLAGASVYEHISKNGAVTIAKDPGRDVTHTLTHSHVHDAHTFTNLTPSPCTHLHQPHTFTMHTPSPTSHLHHAHTFTNLTPSPCTHLHQPHTFTMHTPSQHSAPSHAYRTCTFPLTTPLTHMCTYLTPSHHSLLPSVTHPSLTCSPASHPHTLTPSLTTSLIHSPLTHMFTCLTPSHHHSLLPSFTHPSLTCSPTSHPHTITHYFPQSLTPHSHVHLPHTFTPLTTSLSHSTLTHMFTCLTPSHHHSLLPSFTHMFTCLTPSHHHSITNSTHVHHPTSHPDLEVKALKIYSPDGPRNGVIVTFSTQSAKGLWLAKISEVYMNNYHLSTVVLGI